MKKYKFIFWDMDGTLANTYEGVTNCVKYAMEPYGIHLEGEEELRKFIGPPLRFSFTTYCGLSEEEAEKAIVRYRERYIPIGVYECELFEGVRETIQAFKEAGYIQVITSSKPEAQCRQVLEKFDLLPEIHLGGRQLPAFGVHHKAVQIQRLLFQLDHLFRQAADDIFQIRQP